MNTNADHPAPTQPNSGSEPATPGRLRHLRIGPAFWTVASILSISINLMLIVLVLALAGQIFSLKSLLNDQLLSGLYQNFVLMDQAHIRTVIPVSTEVPAKFDLPLETNTTVTLTENTYIANAEVVSLVTGGLSIYNAPADIVLPAGTKLPVQLKLMVPVDQKIPVELNVNVDIPLEETELHQPFVGLQQVVKPYVAMMDQLPDSWNQILCATPDEPVCSWFFPPKE